MSGGHDAAPMASAAMADGDGDDADDVAEEEHSGSGQAEDSDRNGADSIGMPSAATADRHNGDAEEDDRSGIDSDEQQQEGGVADEMADEEESPQAGADSEPEADGAGDDSEDSDDWGFSSGDDYEEADGAGDDSEESDDWGFSSGDDYEEHGHPVVAATGVTVPDGCAGPTDIEARFPLGTNEATKQLTLGVIGRTITPHQVTNLIRQQGADPNTIPRLRKKGSSDTGHRQTLLGLAIADKTDCSISSVAAGGDDGAHDVYLPQWSSDGLEEGILTALIEAGADLNAVMSDSFLREAIQRGSKTALDVLMARQDIVLRQPSAHMLMELPRPVRPPPPEYPQVLMSMYRQLIQDRPSLATEERYGYNLVDSAAGNAQAHYPQPFIDSYLDLITAKGADMTTEDDIGRTPLHCAAMEGSPKVADYLCRKLPADQINRQDGLDDTPLALAAFNLDRRLEAEEAEIPNLKLIIRSLLRAGGDINLIPTATEEYRRQRQLVLTEYATVLNALPTAVMAAVNAALAPHRSLAGLLTPRLAVGPQEAPIFGWRIASYLFDMDAAQKATTEEAISVRHTDMARRVCAVAEHFVRSAVYQASSNRKVVGGTVSVGGQVVRVPQLQCFVVGGVDGQRMELREVVQRAILDEAAKWGLAGEIDNGFRKDVPAVVWGAVGWVDKGRDGRESFRRLRMT
ncbi:unnamed protein product [Vitrella brassicaformis CCMP3155]|uniref:Uncharacterized protein n=1 Tax=Vitrella brassicaformis (strain CCMP3155) TaxID=1169540 RepID=A0A0G4G655_VITBC|nr:unnamed protein product [Vitrella brassicaformis CCMP3155]|eukprot:CEM23922.1 unnamed protein product [Vitrella brassicaformis CCMP3155]